MFKSNWNTWWMSPNRWHWHISSRWLFWWHILLEHQNKVSVFLIINVIEVTTRSILSSTVGILTGFSPGLIWAGLAGRAGLTDLLTVPLEDKRFGDTDNDILFLLSLRDSDSILWK